MIKRPGPAPESGFALLAMVVALTGVAVGGLWLAGDLLGPNRPPRIDEVDAAGWRRVAGGVRPEDVLRPLGPRIAAPGTGRVVLRGPGADGHFETGDDEIWSRPDDDLIDANIRQRLSALRAASSVRFPSEVGK